MKEDLPELGGGGDGCCSGGGGGCGCLNPNLVFSLNLSHKNNRNIIITVLPRGNCQIDRLGPSLKSHGQSPGQSLSLNSH